MKNHMLDVAFIVLSENTWDNLTADELLTGIENRVRYFRTHPEELLEACGHCDSYEV